MDWNWFFSAFAQSAAAIVGIFGAFIISKIINNQSKFNENKGLLQQYLNDALNLKNRFYSCNIEWYNERTRESSLEDISLEIKKGESLLNAGQYYNNYHFSEYDDREKILEEIENLIRSRTSSEEDISNSFKSTQISKLTPFMYNTSLYNLKIQLHQELNIVGRNIHEITNEIYDHIRKIKTFLNKIKDNPESSTLIKYAICGAILLFISGVILPLLFLPMYNYGSFVFLIKKVFKNFPPMISIILSSFFTIFLVLMGYFLYVNQRLKYDAEEIEELEKFIRLKEYSPYFKNFE